MSRVRLVLTCAGLVGAALAPAAGAAARTKPVTSTFYLHGSGVASAQAAMSGGTGVLSMDRTKATAGSDSDFPVATAATAMDPTCVGDARSLFPTWSGAASGTLSGNVEVILYSRSAPGGTVRINLFADRVDKTACGAARPALLATAVVRLAESPLSIASTVNLSLRTPAVLKRGFTLQIQPAGTNPTGSAGVPAQLSDVVFDSSASPSRLTWTCAPTAGKRSC